MLAQYIVLASKMLRKEVMILCDKCQKRSNTVKDYLIKINIDGEDNGSLLQFLCDDCWKRLIIIFAGEKRDDRLETRPTPQA